MILPRLFAALLALAPIATHAQSAWDATPWLADLEAMRTALKTQYANREWLEKDRGVAIDALADRYAAALARAGSDAEARALLERMVQRIGDGHVALDWPRPAVPPPPPGRPVPPVPMSPDLFCKVRGYGVATGPGIAASLPGYRALPPGSYFEAGVAPVGKAKLGVIRVGMFAPEAFAELCTGVVQDLAMPIDRPCDAACEDRLITEAYRRMTFGWMARLESLRRAGATHLLVDLTGNGGGSEWAEAAARALTRKQLVSAKRGFVRGPHWEAQWRELAEQLRTAADGAAPVDRPRLLAWAAQADAARQEAATPCDPATGCAWLGRAGYATGLVGSAPDGAFAQNDWGGLVFSAGQYAYPYRSGAWDGPLIVLVDDETWSAAEQFAALLQDNRAAVILGARTGGAGCGHTNGGTPVTLPNSRAVFQIPDCVRFRADGSNEVNGVIPDVPVAWRARDGAALKLRLLGAALPAAIQRASALAADRTKR